MPQPIQIASATEAGNPEKKDNEDAFGARVSADGQKIAAIVCDGVSQRCQPSGEYPRAHGRRAADMVAWHMMQAAVKGHVSSVATLQNQLLLANQDVRRYNESVQRWNITDWTTYDRSATCVVYASGTKQPDGTLSGYVVSCGDSLAIHFSPGKTPVMLTRDQLQPALREGARRGWEEMDPHWAAWSRGEVRNNHTLLDELQNPLGYGVIDGNPVFEHFLDVSWFCLAPGDTLLVASDALRALGDQVKVDDGAAYQHLTYDLTNMPVERVPGYLIQKTRQAERQQERRVDDATAIVIRN